MSVAVLKVLVNAISASLGFGLLLLPLHALAYLGVAKLFLGAVPALFDGRPIYMRPGVMGCVGLWVSLFVFFGFRFWIRGRRRLRLIEGGQPHPRTLATFRRARFNTTEDKESFVNEGCLGDDVMLAGLAADGVEVDREPHAEDFGWHGRFSLSSDDHYDLLVSFEALDEMGGGTWWIHIERSGTPFSSNRRARGGLVQGPAVSAVHALLARTDDVEDLRWHFDTPLGDGAIAA